MIAEGDTYQNFPTTKPYPHLEVNYVKLDRVPASTKTGARPEGHARRRLLRHQRRSPVPQLGRGGKARRGLAPRSNGRSRWSSSSWSGATAKDRPPGDVRTDSAPFGSQFRIPFDPAGKKWVVRGLGFRRQRGVHAAGTPALRCSIMRADGDRPAAGMRNADGVEPVLRATTGTEWISLFDGKSLAGWKEVPLGDAGRFRPATE